MDAMTEPIPFADALPSISEAMAYARRTYGMPGLELPPRPELPDMQLTDDVPEGTPAVLAGETAYVPTGDGRWIAANNEWAEPVTLAEMATFGDSPVRPLASTPLAITLTPDSRDAWEAWERDHVAWSRECNALIREWCERNPDAPASKRRGWAR